MGQHTTNPIAQAAKRGELKPRVRAKVAALAQTLRSVLEKVIGGRRVYSVATDGSIRRRFPKVRGKAAVKRAKKARRLARKVA